MDICHLDLHKVMYDSDGIPYRYISDAVLQKFGIKDDVGLAAHRDSLPVLELGHVILNLVDVIPLTANSDFMAYNELVQEIRRATRNEKNSIALIPDQVLKLLKIFEKGIEGRPEYNRKMLFVYNALKDARIDGDYLKVKPAEVQEND